MRQRRGASAELPSKQRAPNKHGRFCVCVRVLPAPL